MADLGLQLRKQVMTRFIELGISNAPLLPKPSQPSKAVSRCRPPRHQPFMSGVLYGRRTRGLQQAAANAARRDGGGTVLHELPEFMLPTALHVLAHHPDYPTPEVRRLQRLHG